MKVVFTRQIPNQELHRGAFDLHFFLVDLHTHGGEVFFRKDALYKPRNETGLPTPDVPNMHVFFWIIRKSATTPRWSSGQALLDLCANRTFVEMFANEDELAGARFTFFPKPIPK